MLQIYAFIRINQYYFFDIKIEAVSLQILEPQIISILQMAKKEKTAELIKVANCDLQSVEIESLIHHIRGKQVILDRDLAALYKVDTKRLNEQVKRNKERFPEDFMFQLSTEEFENWKSQFATSKSIIMGARKKPYAFTESGIAMLSSVLRSEIAIEVNIRIMRAFVAMRHFLASNTQLFQRLETIEYHQLEMQRRQDLAENRIDEIFNQINKSEIPEQGIFYDGQIYDAYSFVAELIRSARNNIILIDNYVDDTVLTLLNKRNSDITATIYTDRINRNLQLDIERHNAQYPPIKICIYKKAHDRFLIIDDKIYHIGASIKDLGKKLFGFSLMHELSVGELIDRISTE